jgi:hypothetical protein
MKQICHFSKTVYPFEHEKVELLLSQILLVVSKRLSILIVIIHI